MPTVTPRTASIAMRCRRPKPTGAFGSVYNGQSRALRETKTGRRIACSHDRRQLRIVGHTNYPSDRPDGYAADMAKSTPPKPCVNCKPSSPHPAKETNTVDPASCELYPTVRYRRQSSHRTNPPAGVVTGSWSRRPRASVCKSRQRGFQFHADAPESKGSQSRMAFGDASPVRAQAIDREDYAGAVKPAVEIARQSRAS